MLKTSHISAAETSPNVAISDDGGRTWRRPIGTLPQGYMSGAAFVPGTGGRAIVAVGLGGTAVSNDRAKVKQLFSTPAKAWWNSADDPNIRVLKVMPDDAEFWDTPGSVISYVKMAAAAVRGSRPEIGDNKKVAL